MFSLIYARIGEAGDMRRHRARYNFIHVYIMNTPPLLLSRLTWEAKFIDVRRFAWRLWLLRADESHTSKITHSGIAGSCLHAMVIKLSTQGSCCPNENSNRAEAYWLKAPQSWSNYTLRAGRHGLSSKGYVNRGGETLAVVFHIKTGRLKQIWSSKNLSSQPPPTPDQTVCHARTQAWKIPPFRVFWARKAPLFQPKSLILRSNKTAIFKSKPWFHFHYIDKVPFCESEINCINHLFCVHRIFHYA